MGEYFLAGKNNIHMNYHHGDLAEAVVKWLIETGNVERALSIDLETKVLNEDEFLTGELILCVSLAYFANRKVCKKVLVLEEENLQSEGKLLSAFDDFLLQMRPLVLIGYNLCGYDIPLLNLKLRMHLERIYWGIKDTIERCFPIDMKHPIRFELARYSSDGAPKILPLSKVVAHERWAELPLMRTKNLVSNTVGKKGREIYQMWKKDREEFVKYAEGDANDVLLIFEELFLKRLFTISSAEVKR